MNNASFSKWPVFLFEALSAYGATLYSTYFYFCLTGIFHFSNKQNLMVAGANGFFATIGAWWGSRFSDKIGGRNMLRLGIVWVILMLIIAGWYQRSVQIQIICFLGWCMGISVTWPVLQSLISEGEPESNLPRRIGMYNLVWSCLGAVAYFTGGALIQFFGMKVIYLLPIGMHVVQLVIDAWFDKRSSRTDAVSDRSSIASDTPAETGFPHRPIARARFFLRIAWLANPFAYIAIQCLVPIIPSIAEKLHLNTLAAGVVCSVWMFSRMFAFFMLYRWQGWHYRFRWFAGALVTLLISFVGIRITHSVGLLVLFQVAFGLAVGLIYYSSLYYSMDLGRGSAKHGGIHEAAIGCGVFAGPALAATSLHLAPGYPNAGVWAAGLLMAVAFSGVLYMRIRAW